ncbi:hypothetical protein AJ80_07764 [Polytolypa hystricis UAMH7299]|uniref:Uncharacterized protein n=1 Tax=Polytolypa hystricis (strain UAMH7299) TaxID=1447883 RepID=A0A2B7XJK8_POLH7|nr:hypothetical protein AJ80_07764 [Polytolypa hystricis UAMH7299]
MFSSGASSPTNPAAHSRSNFTLPRLPKQALPTGECRFILLHPSISNQRCPCQGFRRNESRPGSNCECGHQACYHAPGPSQNTYPAVEKTVPPPSDLCENVVDRICKLEQRYSHDYKFLQDALKEERRSRCEDARVLREAMHAFYKFMEREVPEKFAAIEDKVEEVLDHMLRLEERVCSVDDSNMTLENRVADLEVERDDYENEGEEGEDDSAKGAPDRTYAERSNQHAGDGKFPRLNTSPGPDSNPRAQSHSPTPSTLMPPPERPIRSHLVSPSSSRCSSSASDSSASSSGSDLNPVADCATPLEFLNAPAPIPGAHTYVHVLSSPTHDLISPLLPQPELAKSPIIHDMLNSVVNPPLQHHHSSSQGEEQQGKMNLQLRRPPPPHLQRPCLQNLSLSGHLAKKRKRDPITSRQIEGDSRVEKQLQLSIPPNPPPLSLSDSDVKG